MAEISKNMIRGHTDAIVLNILAQGDSYGYRIAQDVKKMSDNQYEINEATLYTVFRRLEKEGLVAAYYGDESQGGRRKYYKILPDGLTMLDQYRTEWQIAQKIIDKLVLGKVQ